MLIGARLLAFFILVVNRYVTRACHKNKGKNNMINNKECISSICTICGKII